VRGGLLVSPEEVPDPLIDIPASSAAREHVAVLAGGCFWCVEAVYHELDGILSATSGYAGATAITAGRIAKPVSGALPSLCLGTRHGVRNLCEPT
jgi:hypothetical protein